MKDETFKIDGLKIIDFNKEGNAVRFFLGKKDCNDYWGDDWNDRPYEHNAGRVYGKFIEGYVDIGFDLDTLVLEPCSGYINSPFSKEDFKKVDTYFKDKDYKNWTMHDPTAPPCCDEYRKIALALDTEFQDVKYAKPGKCITTKNPEKFR